MMSNTYVIKNAMETVKTWIDTQPSVELTEVDVKYARSRKFTYTSTLEYIGMLPIMATFTSIVEQSILGADIKVDRLGVVETETGLELFMVLDEKVAYLAKFFGGKYNDFGGVYGLMKELTDPADNATFIITNDVTDPVFKDKFGDIELVFIDSNEMATFANMSDPLHKTRAMINRVLQVSEVNTDQVGWGVVFVVEDPNDIHPKLTKHSAISLLCNQTLHLVFKNVVSTVNLPSGVWLQNGRLK